MTPEPEDIPRRLADLYHHSEVGDLVVLPELPDAPYAGWGDDMVAGAGFESAGGAHIRRLRTLPDTVGPRMRLLVVGLNPSEYAADAGVGFARPGNRFWPAAIEAGLVTRARDPLHALSEHAVGMTDLVKRATPRADALTRTEYREGMARVGRLAAWLRPRAICFVGLAGYRAAVERGATAGWQPQEIGGRRTYLMPNPSGLNTHVRVADLAGHLCAALM